MYHIQGNHHQKSFFSALVWLVVMQYPCYYERFRLGACHVTRFTFAKVVLFVGLSAVSHKSLV